MTKLLLVSVLAVAALLRLYHLGHESFWGDELGQVLVAQNDIWQTILDSAKHRGNTPLDYVITHLMLYVGRDEAILRLPAALFGVGAVWLLYQLGRTLFDETTALLAAALLAIAPLHIAYSQELRFYSLATFTILATVYFGSQAEDKRQWARFAIVAAISLYAHYYTLLVLAALGLWLLLYRRAAFVSFALASGMAVLLFAPWLWYDVIRPGTPNSNPAEFVPPALDVAIAGLFGLPVESEGCYWKCQTASGALLVAPAVLFVVLRGYRRTLALLLCVIVVGIGGVFALNIYGRYFFATRQLLMFLPFVLLLLASAPLVVPRYRAALGALVLVVAVVLFAPRVVEMHTTPPSTDWRGVAMYLLEKQSGESVVLTGTPAYLHWYAPRLRIVEVNRGNVLETFDALRAEGKTVWLVPGGETGWRLLDPIFQVHERYRLPAFDSPVVYAIPHPGEW